VECKRLLTHASKLQRERGNVWGVAQVLRDLSDANRRMDLPEEGIRQARVLHNDKQLDAAEEAASHAINLCAGKGEQYLACETHIVLGEIYRSKGETEKAIHHLELALGITSSFSWHDALFWVHCSLGQLFLDKSRFDDAHTHLDYAKSHAINNTYHLGLAMRLRADIWRGQRRLEEAKTEALRAVDVYEKLGAARDMEIRRRLVQRIQKELDSQVAPDQSGFNCKLLQMAPLPTCIHSLF